MFSRKISLFTIFNTTLMLFLVFVTMYPFWYMINVSLSSEIAVMQNKVSFWPIGFTTRWYEIVLKDPNVLLGYRNTMLYVSLGTAIALAFTSMGAYALAKRKLIYRRQFMLAIVFTMMFSGGMIPSYLVTKSLGMVNTIWAMVIPGAVSAYYLIVMRTFFEAIPEEIEDSGRVDGLNDIGIFMRIIVPLSKPVFATIGLFVAVGIWNDFYTALIYLRKDTLMPLQVILRDLVIKGDISIMAASKSVALGKNKGGDYVVESLKFATIVAGTLPILVVYPFLQKYFIKGVMIGSVKG